MKKLMFFTIVFGLMMIFNGSAAAQIPFQISNSNGSFKPSAGGEITLAIQTKGSGENSTKYLFLKLTTNGKYATALLQIPKDREEAVIAYFKKYSSENYNGTMTNVQNSIEIQGRDILKLIDGGKGWGKFEVIRNNKSLGVMTLQHEKNNRSI